MQKKKGRPKNPSPPRMRTLLLPQDLDARVERSRARRQQRSPASEVTYSETLRALLATALTLEEQAEPQAELPFFTTTSPESSTKKS